MAALLRQTAGLRDRSQSRLVEEALDAYLSPHVVQLGHHEDDLDATKAFTPVERAGPSWLTWGWVLIFAAAVIIGEAVVVIVLLTS